LGFGTPSRPRPRTMRSNTIARRTTSPSYLSNCRICGMSGRLHNRRPRKSAKTISTI
jgi:hypothetical protein